MKLDSIHIKNFKGVGTLMIAMDCQNTSIFGANASGKSTIADSITWLLFDKDSLGAKDFSIKPIDPILRELDTTLLHALAIVVPDPSTVWNGDLLREEIRNERVSSDELREYRRRSRYYSCLSRCPSSHIP